MSYNFHMRQPEHEWPEIIEAIKYEDPLDFFVRFVKIRGPTIYILINMTLMIWIAQNMLTSNLQQIPRSLYLAAPLFNQNQIRSIIYTLQQQCPQLYEPIILKTFPVIQNPKIHSEQMKKWGDQIIFCVQRFNQSSKKQSCQIGQIKCNDYCEKSKKKCPITSIEKTYFDQEEGANEEKQILYISKDDSYAYVIRRGQGNPIVTLRVAYESYCANDEHFKDVYGDLNDYWSAVRNCSSEGKLNGIMTQLDQMQTKDFLTINNINIENVAKEKFCFLGTISKPKFDITRQICKNTQIKAKNLANLLEGSLISSSFVEMVLVTCLAFFFFSWIWLIAFYCIQGFTKQKNVFVSLMAVVQLIVVGYIYVQNTSLFETNDLLNDIKSCLEIDWQATQQWNFGLQSSSPFVTVIYLGCVFLILQIVCLIIDKFVYYIE